MTTQYHTILKRSTLRLIERISLTGLIEEKYFIIDNSYLYHNPTVAFPCLDSTGRLKLNLFELNSNRNVYNNNSIYPWSHLIIYLTQLEPKNRFISNNISDSIKWMRRENFSADNLNFISQKVTEYQKSYH